MVQRDRAQEDDHGERARDRRDARQPRRPTRHHEPGDDTRQPDPIQVCACSRPGSLRTRDHRPAAQRDRVEHVDPRRGQDEHGRDHRQRRDFTSSRCAILPRRFIGIFVIEPLDVLIDVAAGQHVPRHRHGESMLDSCTRDRIDAESDDPRRAEQRRQHRRLDARQAAREPRREASVLAAVASNAVPATITREARGRYAPIARPPRDESRAAS